MILLSLDEFTSSFGFLVRSFLNLFPCFRFILSKILVNVEVSSCHQYSSSSRRREAHTFAVLASLFSCSREVFKAFSTCLFSFFSSLCNFFSNLLDSRQNITIHSLVSLQLLREREKGREKRQTVCVPSRALSILSR